VPSPREPGPGAAQPNRKCERFWTLPPPHAVLSSCSMYSRVSKCSACIIHLIVGVRQASIRPKCTTPSSAWWRFKRMERFQAVWYFNPQNFLKQRTSDHPPACDPRCYWLPPHKPLLNREANLPNMRELFALLPFRR
jgi:hypothetical protein